MKKLFAMIIIGILCFSMFFVLKPVIAGSSVLLSDDFTTDSSLNTGLWQANGAVGNTLANMWQAQDGGYPVTIETPTLTFSATTGMGVSGVTGTFQISTIQSVASFSPPFTLQATAMATVANGNPFALIITSSDGNEAVGIDGDLNAANGGYYGMWVSYSQNGGWVVEGTKLVSSPGLSYFYPLSINVDSSGLANLTVSSGPNYILGSILRQVGNGPFYILLAQIEGLPYTVGPNQAYWKSITLTSNAPAPPQSSTSVICSPNPVSVGSPVTCTATVSGSNPTGTIIWSSSSSTGTFSSTQTSLTSPTTYTDTSPGTVTLTASYSGDSNNAASSGSITLTITYTVSIDAHDNTQHADVSVGITEDGVATGYSTPYTFTGLSGSHTFGVPSTDTSGNPFTEWSTGQTTTTITISSAGTYTAYYQAVSSIQYSLTVSSAYASPSPSVGSHSYGSGTSVTCSVSSPVIVGGVSYTCTGWTGTGSVPSIGTGTSVTFTITEDSTITWNWQAQYSVTVTSQGGGSVTVQSSAINGGTSVVVGVRQTKSWNVPVDSSVTLTASPNSGNAFGLWTVSSGINGPGGSLDTSSPTIQIVATADCTIQANFIQTISTSTWAGYLVEGSQQQPVTMINGSWIVQTVAPTLGLSYASQWIGIGGLAPDSTLIQTGTASATFLDQTDYYAWYETLPSSPARLWLQPVKPSDIMQAEIFIVDQTANQWNITINDLTENWHFSTLTTYSSSKLSAEWIEEHQWSSLGSLANFGVAYFNTNYATIGSTSSSIGSFCASTSFSTYAISMNDPTTQQTLAVPSPLTSDGSFNVAWKAGGTVPRQIFAAIVLSPANLFVTDPQGRSIGLDPSTGEVVNDIPGGFYSGPGTEPQFVAIPNSINGPYSITLVGTANGNYTLIVENATSTQTTTQTLKGTISSGEIQEFKVEISYAIILTPEYAITFTESGLPPGTAWSVLLTTDPAMSPPFDAERQGAMAGYSLTFEEPDGAYSYTVDSVSGFTSSPSSGNITLNGGNVNQPITFTVAPSETPLLGVKNVVTLNNVSVLPNLASGLWTGGVAGTEESFSIEQNFLVIVPTQSGAYQYWVQNIIFVEGFQPQGWYAMGITNIYDYTAGFYEGRPLSPLVKNYEVLADNPTLGHLFSVPGTYTLTSYISGGQLIMSNDFFNYTWPIPTGNGQLVQNASIASPGPLAAYLAPELVIVGPPINTTAVAAAVFLSPTSFSVQSYVLLKGQSWTSSVDQSPINYGSAAAVEKSWGLNWMTSTPNTPDLTAEWRANNQQGIFFSPADPSVNQASLMSASVSVAVPHTRALWPKQPLPI